jgi:hypothetical protein
MKVCALANQLGGPYLERVLALERSLTRKGVPFVLTVENGPWSWERKVRWELEQVQADPDGLFVFVDAFDYLFMGTRDELEAVISAQPLLFSTDCGTAPYPDRDLAAAYDDHRRRLSPWCWLNGSGPAGRGSAIAEAIRWGLDHVAFEPPTKAWRRGGTDQLWWTHVYLAGFGVLDQQCRLTQALYDVDHHGVWITPHLGHKDGRITNLLTGTQPQFLHASGNSWAAIPEELWK